MKTTAGFRAQQVMRLTVVSTLLFLTVGADAPLYAASSRNPLPEVSPAMFPPQGILLVYSERYVIEDDGVNVIIEVSEEDYKADLAAGIDEEATMKTGRYKFKRGGFLERHPELKIKARKKA